MSKVKDLKAQLDAKGITYPSRAKVADLEALLASGAPVVSEAPAPTASASVTANLAPHVDAVDEKAKTTDLSGIEVGDPEILRPVELPLVVKPKSGAWANKQQAKYAATLNAYAYSNPDKWAKKKKVLLARLVEIGNDPEAFQKYAALTVGNGKLTYNDKRFGQGNESGDAAAEE